MNKQGIYEEATRKELSNNPNGTRMDVVYAAMDEYAKQKAIDFAKWLSDNDYKPFKKMGEDHWLTTAPPQPAPMPEKYGIKTQQGFSQHVLWLSQQDAKIYTELLTRNNIWWADVTNGG